MVRWGRCRDVVNGPVRCIWHGFGVKNYPVNGQELLARRGGVCYNGKNRFFMRGVGFSVSHRVTTTLSDEEFLTLQHWAKQSDVSINDFIREAIMFRIRWKQKDYPLAPLEVQRLNQLLDAVMTLSSNVNSLEQVVVSGFDSLLGLVRGDNYLLEEGGDDVV